MSFRFIRDSLKYFGFGENLIEWVCILIQGFKIHNFRAFLSLYADDCLIFLSYNESDLRNTITILNEFYRVSGLEIHLGKTQCVRIGSNPDNMPIFCHDLGLTWLQEFKLLGVLFNASTLDYNINFDIKLEEIIKETKNWRHCFPWENHA